MSKIFLIGYMGSGKTTIGKHLAARLKLPFIDVDTFIENRFRKTIAQLFEERGEEQFRLIEQNIIKELVDFEDVVISTGGGLPCFFDNMELMNRSGQTVYLRTGNDELAARLNQCKQSRPLIKEKSPEEIKRFVEENMTKRKPFYEQASVSIDVDILTTEEDIARLVDKLLNHITL